MVRPQGWQMGRSVSWMGQGSPQARQMRELLVFPSRKAGCRGSLLQQAIAASLRVRLPVPPAMLLRSLLASAVVTMSVLNPRGVECA